jgi:beta-glucosidase
MRRTNIVFQSKKSHRLMALALSAVVGLTATFAAAETVTPTGNTYGFAGTNARYYTDYMTLEEEQQIAKDLAIEVASEGFVLLKNENNVLPLAKGGKVSLFGMHSVSLIASTSGSAGGSTGANGIAESTLQIAMEKAGYRVNAKLVDLYTKHKTLGTTSNELPMKYYSAATISSYNGYGDAAIIVFSRTGSEGGDKLVSNVTDHSNPRDHELMLDDNEKALVKHVKEHYPNKPIIVLINSSNILQIPELAEPKATSEYGVDAIFWVGNTGNNAIEAIGKLISGEVNPSGHTVEVWERDFTKGPSFTNFGNQTQNVDENGDTMDAFFYHNGEATKYATIEYREGIYVGYKYYETRYEDAVMEQGNASGNAGIFASKGDSWVYGEEVAYPFGYGMSYTTFEQALESVTYDAATDSFTVLVKVTNTGNVAGKEVVQVYGQQPYTEFDRANAIEKASVQLVGFGKTNVLQPGESETVSVTVDRKELTVYDEHVNKTYILEAGDYYLSVGLDAHDAVNNILAAKGYAPIAQETPAAEGAEEAETATLTANGAAAMDAPGDAAKVYKFTVDSDDNATYSVSGTGYKITNQFGDADLNSYGEKLVTYLSRSDWQGTWPVSYASLTANDAIINGLQFNYTAEAPDETVITGSTATNYTLANLIGKDYDDPMWVDLLNQLTLTDLAELVGHSGYGTRAIDSIGLPATVAADGPQGIKATYAGNNSTVAYTSEPVMAATFNTEILYNVGLSMGEDALRSDNRVVGWYGPAMNIHRTPYSGRNFEYYSEDGFLSGKMAAQEVAAARSKGLVVYIKHFALNDFETYRQSVATFATEQAIREIYLKGFQYAVEEGGANAAMTSFNRIGTRWAGAHSGLCNEVLRKEWGFVGVTLTDAVMANRNWMDVSIGLEAGNDTWLSSGDWLVSKIEGWAAEDGKLLNNLRTSAKNFLYTYANSAAMNGMNETSHVVHTTSWVETDMLIARIVLIVLTALFGLAMLVSYFMDVKKKAASADRKTVSIVAAVIAVLAAIFYIIIDTAATTKMNFDAVVLVLLLVSAVCYLVAGVKKIGLLAAAGLACTLVAWFRYLVTEINFRMDDLVLIFGGTSTIGALGVPFILSFILMLLAAISGAVLMTGAMGSEKK